MLIAGKENGYTKKLWVQATDIISVILWNLSESGWHITTKQGWHITVITRLNTQLVFDHASEEKALNHFDRITTELEIEIHKGNQIERIDRETKICS